MSKTISPSQLKHEEIDRIKNRALNNRVIEEPETEANMTIEEFQDLEQSVSSRDSNFRSELDYDGYKDIQAYDNDEYRANVELEEDSPDELQFAERMENGTMGEESVVDKQDNRRAS